MVARVVVVVAVVVLEPMEMELYCHQTGLMVWVAAEEGGEVIVQVRVEMEVQVL